MVDKDVAEGIPWRHPGAAQWKPRVAERVKRPGVAIGLAWTPAGGDILFIEANKMKGKGGFTMTGQIGEVMQESMQAALTWVRSNSAMLNLPEDFNKDLDLHIHVPAGAIPKDGPSAGVTASATCAGIAADRCSRFRPLTAMTGEITGTQRERASRERHQGREVPGSAPGGSGNHHSALPRIARTLRKT